MAAAAEYTRTMDWDAVRAHEHHLLAGALEGLDALPKVTVYGRARDRTSTLMFTVDGLTSEEAAAKLAEHQVAVWHGNYYAHELERLLGLAPHGAVRAGFVHYNDERDLERLLDAVESL